MDANTLIRYFFNKYSRKDFLSVNEAFQNKNESLQLEKQLEDHWMELSEENIPEVKLNHILDKVQHRIYIEENGKRKVISIWQIAQRIAAILFLPLLIASLVFSDWKLWHSENDLTYTEIQCPLGVRTKFQLPDGSTGFLNSGSTLKYYSAFAHNRKVYLKGEGYFEVKHIEKSPFHVETKKLDIQVVGTTFNVIAYDDEIVEEIILQTGRVNVNDNKGKRIASLIPDQKLILKKESMKFNVGTVVAEQYTSWKEGKLMFRNENIDDVAIRLSRWYNTDILIDNSDKQISTYTFHGTFVNEQLDDVLKVLSLASPISYKEITRKPDNNGIYPKRKIILSINPIKPKNLNNKPN